MFKASSKYLNARLFSRLSKLWPSRAVQRLISHNLKVFSNSDNKRTSNSEILMELNTMHSAHIAYSYLAQALAIETNAQIKAYIPNTFSNFNSKFAYKIKKKFDIDEVGVYKSFGTTNFIQIEISDSIKEKSRILYAEIFMKLNNKRDIEELSIHGIWIGDLIYDTYLKRFSKPTIDQNSIDFQHFLLDSIELFLFWEEYLNSHDVLAINVSHCVYDLAIPLRIAIELNIPVFQTSITHVYRMTQKNLFAYNDFVYFRERFANLPDDVKRQGLAKAKERIQRRFAGEVGVDMAYSTKSAYGTLRQERLLRESPRKKILIATHCFFDSPHSYGKNIFPDFYEWLDFLGKITEVTDYDWYIKTHPDYLPGTKEIIDGFVEKYPKLTLLPSNASHHQIIAEGIDIALTVYGTIAFEYAALGIPVINNSLNNPHIAYDFNIHSKNVEDYRRLLLELDSLEFSIDREQVYEYYFMKYIYNTENIFLDSYSTTINELGGYSAQFTPAFYDKWLKEWNNDKHKAIIVALQAYIKSGDFRMDYRHFGREFKI